MLHWESSDGIAVLALEHGPVNALDGDFLREIADTLRAIADGDVDALIFTGKGKTFSAGADLYRVLEGGKMYVEASVDALTDAFGTLFTFPRPVIAAINGHAIAGGGVFACAADHRVMARGSGVIGLAELRVGVPFPTYALEIVRHAVAPQHFQEIIYLAKNYEPEEALAKGLIDEIVEPADLMDRCFGLARALSAIPRPTFEIMKTLVRAPTIDRVERYRRAHDRQVQDLWTSPEVHSAIRAFLDTLHRR